MNFKPINLLRLLVPKPFVIHSNPTHLLSLFVKWILDYLPTLLTHHLEAGATLRNNPRENHISFHMKDVFDSVKSDSNRRGRSANRPSHQTK